MNKAELIQRLISDLDGLPRHYKGKLDRLIKKADLYIKKVFGDSSQYLDYLHGIPFISVPQYGTNRAAKAKELWDSGQIRMRNLFDTMLEDVEPSETEEQSGEEWVPDKSRANSKQVFIVHGRDEANALKLEKLLAKRWDLEPDSGERYTQARPNVIFELGWFYGRLRRDKVCILFKKGAKIHSDLDGINRVEFSESVDEKIADIKSELKEAGVIATEQ